MLEERPPWEKEDEKEHHNINNNGFALVPESFVLWVEDYRRAAITTEELFFVDITESVP